MAPGDLVVIKRETMPDQVPLAAEPRSSPFGQAMSQFVKQGEPCLVLEVKPASSSHHFLEIRVLSSRGPGWNIGECFEVISEPR